MKNICLLSLLFVTLQSKAQPAADSLLNFILQHKDKSALYLVKNDTVQARWNENKMMPLASTMKVLVALEFAKQAAQNVFDPQQKVALAELKKYYLPNTDADAHPAWLKYEQSMKHITNDSISLMNVARGMTIFSSNANTEFLMDLLGLDNVKNNMQLFGIKDHSTIFPVVASLFMFQNPKRKSEESILKGIRNLSEEQYCRYIYDMHKALKFDTVLKSKFRPQDLSPKMQKLWSDRLPASTVKAYAQICHVINNRKYFDEKTYEILSNILEYIMENPENKTWLKHAGMKGGSTPWVFTKATYATTKGDERYEFAYFFNDITPAENEQVQRWANSFERAILANAGFVAKLKTALR